MAQGHSLDEPVLARGQILKAAAVKRWGDVSGLSVIDVREREPGPLEVTVGIKFAGLNHLDIWVRRGMPFLKLSLPPKSLQASRTSFGIGEDRHCDRLVFWEKADLTRLFIICLDILSSSFKVCGWV